MPAHSISSSEAESSDESVEQSARGNASMDEFSLKNSLDFELDMKPLEVDSTLITAEELESDAYETWLVTVPSKIDPQSLIDQQLPFHYETQIKMENKKYQTSVYKKITPISLVIADSRGNLKMISKEIQGTVQILEHVPVPEISKDALLPKAPAPIPKSFKRRHPIHGEDIAAILAAQSCSPVKRPKKKKRKSVVANE